MKTMRNEGKIESAKSGNEIRLVSAEFVMAADSARTLPVPSIPEIAFVGRSNVGKSSLVNAFTQRRKLARTSKTPGRTQTFNFYRVSFEKGAAVDEHKESFIFENYFVDLPGYGYAKVAQIKKKAWQEAISQYLLKRKSLEGVLLLIDSRRDPGEEERWIVELGRKGNLWVALTKADKLSASERRLRRENLARALCLDSSRIFPVSVEKKAAGDPLALRDDVFGLISGKK